MTKTYEFGTSGPVCEMAIVDTFTRLIFGEESGFSSSEELIIQAFRLVDSGVALDSHAQMGQYLRALGVKEMIQLVARVQACLADGLQVVVQARDPALMGRRAH